MSQGERTNVLVVEDDDLLGELVTAALSAAGFCTQTITRGHVALRVIESNAAIGLLFTDIILADSMNGATLASRARALRPELPIVYASAFLSAADIDPLVPRSIFVPKPYDPLEVCTLFNRLAPASR